MTVPEAAKQLGIKRCSVHDAVNRGRLTATRRDDQTLDITQEALDAYRASRHQGKSLDPSNVPAPHRQHKSRVEVATEALGDCTREQLYQALKYGYCELADDEIRRRVREMIDYQQAKVAG